MIVRIYLSHMEIKIITLSYPIRTFYIDTGRNSYSREASLRQLQAIVPFLHARRYFVVSHFENGQTMYMATAEETYPGEAEKVHGQILSIEKGDYASILLKDYRQHPQNIEGAFAMLLQYPNLDPQANPIVFYLSDTEVLCMVKILTA